MDIKLFHKLSIKAMPLQKSLSFSILFLLFYTGIFPFTTTVNATEPIRIVYGFDREFPPFSYEAPGGEAIGFEVELLQAIFNDTNTTLVMRPLSWEMVQLELSSGTINIASGMVPSKQREQLFLFSKRPTLPLQVRLFTKVYKRFPSATLLRGQPVSVEKGSYQQRVLEDFGGINIKPYEKRIAGLRALYNDDVAAYCGTVQPTYYYINKLQYGAITTVGTPLAIVDMRYAVSKRRGDIYTLLNTGFDKVVATGEYDRIYRKWFVRELTYQQGKMLIAAAKEGAIPAYTPYGVSQPEGAAILTVTGKTYTGCTVENADSQYNMPAIAAALLKAISAGDFEFQAAVIVTQDGSVVPPRRSDLQLLYEFGQGILYITEADTTKIHTQMISQLLPDPVIKKVRSLNVE